MLQEEARLLMGLSKEEVAGPGVRPGIGAWAGLEVGVKLQLIGVWAMQGVVNRVGMNSSGLLL